MAMSRWVISSGADTALKLEEYARACDAQASVTHVWDSWELRQRLRGDMAGAYALVAEGASGPDAVNAAAAVAADGRAADVVLVMRGASGSLRSRAKRAGVGHVLDMQELEAACREARERVRTGLCANDARGQAAEGLAAAVRRGEAPATNAGVASSLARCESAPAVTRREGVPAAARREGGPAVARREGVPVIAFVSGRGGVGKSTLVALGAHMAAGWGMDVACLDLDLAFGNLSALCGAERALDLAQAAEGELDDVRLESLGAAAAEHVHVWGPCRSPEYAETVQPVAADLVAGLTHSHDLVLIDTSASWGDATASAAQLADRLVIVSDERPGAIPALARCGGLAVRLGIARTRIVRLMNGCDPRMRDASFVARAAVGLECAREVRVPDGGIEVTELMSTGKAAELAALENPMCTALAHGLAELLKELGKLPEHEAATRALENARRGHKLFGRMREAS